MSAELITVKKKQIILTDNSLTSSYPELASQWHASKNGDRKPENISPASKTKAWWQCSVDKTHVWDAVIRSRVDGRGCPFCAGKRVSKENSFSALYPEIAESWHPIKNGDLLPSEFTAYSQQSIWWQCNRGHEWKAKIVTRSYGHNCPKCIGEFLDEACPAALRLWHPTKNGELLPTQVKARSREKFYWRCKKGHEFQALAYSVVDAIAEKKLICTSCRRAVASPQYNLKTECPEAARMWDKKSNGDLRPTDVLPGSPRFVHWICLYNPNHQFQSAVSGVVNAIIKRTATRGCPFCRGSAGPGRRRYDILAWAQRKRRRFLTPEDFVEFYTIRPESAKKLIASLISESRLKQAQNGKFEIIAT